MPTAQPSTEEQEHSHRLWIHGFPPNVTKHEVKMELSRAGQVLNVELVWSRSQVKYLFVDMASQGDASRVREMYDQRKLGCRILRVRECREGAIYRERAVPEAETDWPDIENQIEEESAVIVLGNTDEVDRQKQEHIGLTIQIAQDEETLPKTKIDTDSNPSALSIHSQNATPSVNLPSIQ